VLIDMSHLNAEILHSRLHEPALLPTADYTNSSSIRISSKLLQNLSQDLPKILPRNSSSVFLQSALDLPGSFSTISLKIPSES